MMYHNRNTIFLFLFNLLPVHIRLQCRSILRLFLIMFRAYTMWVVLFINCVFNGETVWHSRTRAMNEGWLTDYLINSILSSSFVSYQQEGACLHTHNCFPGSYAYDFSAHDKISCVIRDGSTKEIIVDSTKTKESIRRLFATKIRKLSKYSFSGNNMMNTYS